MSTTKNYSYIKEISDLDLKFRKKNINDLFFFLYNKDVEYEINPDKKEIKFTLLKPTARIKILGDLVDSWSFSIDGENYFQNNEKDDVEYSNRITGCLSFVDVKVENISIQSNYSLCEDAFNFIRTKGSIKSVKIKNSLSDGLDLDFSNVKISNLNISNSKNDCIDMSYGNYEIVNSSIDNCGDKGISVGEKSKVMISAAKINNSN